MIFKISLLSDPENRTGFQVKTEFIVSLCIVFLILFTYFQVRHFDFVNFDDERYVTDNIHVIHGLNKESFFWAFQFNELDYWFPITWLSHMLDCSLYGLSPGMHHTTNLIIHIMNSLLLFSIFRSITGSVFKSAALSLLFAVHPINVETVAWIAERKNVLSSMFWFLVIVVYTKNVKHPGVFKYFFMLLIFQIGLMTKAMLMTLPMALLLLDIWPLNRFRLIPAKEEQHVFKLIKNFFSKTNRSIFIEKIPMFILSGVSYMVTSESIEAFKGAIPTEDVAFTHRIANAVVSYAGYIRKIFLPTDLAVFYPYPEAIPIWKIIACLILIICIFFIAFWTFKKRPYFLIGWLWFFGCMVPTLGLKHSGVLPAMADRFAYIPSIGLFVVIVWGVADVVDYLRINRKIVTLSTFCFILLLSIQARIQTSYWKNTITLFTHTLTVTKNNDLAHNNLGVAMSEKGMSDEAILHFKKALEIHPNAPDTLTNLGLEFLRIGELEKSLKYYNEALLINPNFGPAHYNLGLLKISRKEFEEAKPHLLKVIELHPNHLKAHYYLGNIYYFHQKDKNKALRHFQNVIRIDPYNQSAIERVKEIEKSFQSRDSFREKCACHFSRFVA